MERFAFFIHAAIYDHLLQKVMDLTAGNWKIILFSTEAEANLSNMTG